MGSKRPCFFIVQCLAQSSDAQQLNWALANVMDEEQQEMYPILFELCNWKDAVERINIDPILLPMIAFNSCCNKNMM